METKKIVMGVISVAVAIIVLMSMIPIFTDAGASEDTFINGDVYFSEVDTNEHTIVIAKSGDNITITTDGVLCKNPDFSLYSSATILFADSTFVRLQSNGTVYLYGQNSSSTYGGVNLGNASDGVTITLNGDTGTVHDVSADSDKTFPNVRYYIAPTGDMTLSLKPYVTEDSFIMGAGITQLSNVSAGLIWYGTNEDDLTVKAVYPSGRTAELNSINLTPVNGYIGLNKVDSVMIDWSNGGNVEGTATYTYFLAPVEVTAERSAHASPVEATLIGLIPLLMMVGIMLTAVGLFIAKYRKN